MRNDKWKLEITNDNLKRTHDLPIGHQQFLRTKLEQIITHQDKKSQIINTYKIYCFKFF